MLFSKSKMILVNYLSFISLFFYLIFIGLNICIYCDIEIKIKIIKVKKIYVNSLKEKGSNDQETHSLTGMDVCNPQN